MRKKSNLLYVSVLLVICLLLSVKGLNATGTGLKIDDKTTLDIGSIFRSYYINDQRIQWSGVEATFGVEAALSAEIQREISNGHILVSAEVFLNQPFDQNILVDESRAKYLPNFQVSRCELAQLVVGLKKKNFFIGLGRKTTPFGRTYSLPLLNNYVDQPFIRTESILRYETGLFMEYSPGILDFSLAVVNGGPEMDTNSSKAGIARLGLKGRDNKWAFGVSAKFQDGIGSENQKQFKNHAGLDLMVKFGPFRVSGEVIYDEYGFRKEYNEEDIFWKRSLYYRDVFYKYEVPVTGIGAYLNLQYEGSKWFLEACYGEFHPEEIGNIYHDEPTKRGIIKVRICFAPGFHLFGMGLFENERTTEPLFKGASGVVALVGLSYEIR